MPAADRGDVFRIPSAARALSGLLISGLLFGFLGAILPAWGYHLTSEFGTVGNYFLSMSAGVIISTEVAGRLLLSRGLRFLFITACALACAALVYLALLPLTISPFARMGALLAIGFATGLMNTAVFHAISSVYDRDPAATVNIGGISFGMGCLVVTLLVAGTFYAYTVSSILIFVAVIPGLFVAWFARGSFPAPAIVEQPSIAQLFRDLRQPGAVLFALLLFFQFGNEWSIAGWLPLFLIRRLGVSPESSLMILAIYWLALVVGRLAAVGLLPRIRHGRFLLSSAGAALAGCLILLATDNLFGAVVGTLLVGGGFASIYPLIAERIGQEFPYFHPGFFNGIFSIALTGGMLAPWTLGQFANIWGIGVVMALPLAGTCMVFVLVLLIWLEAKIRLG
ncbi:MAG TPA: MFS transporter [Bryobacteraceae bacterium]|nr:MFS transporter [Bryobacteraceae bacterium]